MDIKVMRINSAGNSTGGAMFILKDNKWDFLCFTLEDEKREVKKMHETRIPAGIYSLKIREYGGFYERYRQRFAWHKGMIEICNVPEFTDILVHIGNSEADTSGCLLVGLGLELDSNKENRLLNSTGAYEKFYKAVYPALESGKNCQIQLIDFDN